MKDTEQLFESYSKMINSISFRMIENPDTAREAVQEAWEQVLKSLPAFKGESKLSTWIYTIASRTILRFARHEKKYTAADLKDFMHEGSENSGSSRNEWNSDLCDKCLTGSVHCLSNEDRLIYLLYELAELSSREIGRIVSITDAAVRKKLSRSRKKLHSFLHDQCVLYNPEGNCSCPNAKKMKKKADVRDDLKNLHLDIEKLSFLKKSGIVLSKKSHFLHDLSHTFQNNSH